MFKCKNGELTELRQMLLEKVNIEILGLVEQFQDALQLFRGLLPRRKITPLLAKLAYDVLKIFDSVPMRLVSDPTVTVANN
jgi:hypothetical protein